jgi:hypothetical protein
MLMHGHMRSLHISVWCLVALTLPVWAAEKGTVRATSAWVGDERYFSVKEEQALFVGAFGGVMYVETKQGAMDAANILCPGMVEITLTDGKQSGEGRCRITSTAGDKVYATWRCAGEHGAGCLGTFTLTGETGRFNGLTGHRAFAVRSALLALAASTGEQRVQGRAAGVAVWPALTSKIP